MDTIRKQKEERGRRNEEGEGYNRETKGGTRNKEACIKSIVHINKYID